MRIIPRQKNAVITSGVSSRLSGEMKYCRSVPAASRTAMSPASREFTGTTPRGSEDLLPGFRPGDDRVNIRDLHNHGALRLQVGPEFLHPRNVLPPDLAIGVNRDRSLDLEAGLLPPPRE